MEEENYAEKKILPIRYDLQFSTELQRHEIQKLIEAQLEFTDIKIDDNVVDNNFGLDNRKHRVKLVAKFPFKYIIFDNWIDDFSKIPPIRNEIGKRLPGKIIGITSEGSEWGTYLHDFQEKGKKTKEDIKLLIGEEQIIQSFLDEFQDLRLLNN